MAKQTSQHNQTQRYDDEIDLFELLRFVVRGARFYVVGGLVFALLGLLYALTLYPTTYRQQVINDIGLNEEKLNLIRQMLPAMIYPMEKQMAATDLEDLYEDIQKDPDFLNDSIIGLSGLDLKDKALDEASKDKVETVRFLLEGHDLEVLSRANTFLQNNLRGLSQYLGVKRYLDNESRESKLLLFNTESQVNRQQLNFDRAQRQLNAYQTLQQEPNQYRDMQIILNLSNQEERVGDKRNLDNISEFSGSKYLPLGNRILALKSEMADQLEAIYISQQQIQALRLQQAVFEKLNDRFTQIVYQGDVVDLSAMFQVVQRVRQASPLTREETAALDSVERNLLSFERDGLKFKNSLPVVVEKRGRTKVVLIAGLLGGVFGFLLYGYQVIGSAYRRRYQ